MGMLTVSCPSCGFSRHLPSEKVPEGPRRVTCPHCNETFIFDKSVAPGRPAPAPVLPEPSSPLRPGSPLHWTPSFCSNAHRLGIRHLLG
jgi:hypothetical protein